MDAQVAVRMPQDLLDRLRNAAEEDQRPVGNMIRVMVEEALAVRAKGKGR